MFSVFQTEMILNFKTLWRSWRKLLGNLNAIYLQNALVIINIYLSLKDDIYLNKYYYVLFISGAHKASSTSDSDVIYDFLMTWKTAIVHCMCTEYFDIKAIAKYT